MKISTIQTLAYASTVAVGLFGLSASAVDPGTFVVDFDSPTFSHALTSGPRSTPDDVGTRLILNGRVLRGRFVAMEGAGEVSGLASAICTQVSFEPDDLVPLPGSVEGSPLGEDLDLEVELDIDLGIEPPPEPAGTKTYLCSMEYELTLRPISRDIPLMLLSVTTSGLASFDVAEGNRRFFSADMLVTATSLKDVATGDDVSRIAISGGKSTVTRPFIHPSDPPLVMRPPPPDVSYPENAAVSHLVELTSLSLPL